MKFSAKAHVLVGRSRAHVLPSAGMLEKVPVTIVQATRKVTHQERLLAEAAVCSKGPQNHDFPR